MSEVSNKTIVALLVVALVITVVGTLVSVSKLSSLGGKYTTLTGAETFGTGEANITIYGEVSLEVVDGIIQFGTGYYDPSCSTHYAYIPSDGEADNCWLDSTGANPADVDDFHQLRNNGTVTTNVTAELTSSVGVSPWLCGPGDCPDNPTLAGMGIKSKDYTGGGDGAGSCTSGLIGSYTDFATADADEVVTICDRFLPADSNDEIEVNYNITVPEDADRGNRVATITYTAEAIS